jgi:hypothetical protein
MVITVIKMHAFMAKLELLSKLRSGRATSWEALRGAERGRGLCNRMHDCF